VQQIAAHYVKLGGIERMAKYLWESKHGAVDVIRSLVDLTHAADITGGNAFNRELFNYKGSESEGYKFTLSWVNYGSIRLSMFYQPASIKCTIKSTNDGCTIEAHLLRLRAIFHAFLLFGLVAYFYCLTISVLLRAPFGKIVPIIIMPVLATALLIHFLYTRKKLKTKIDMLGTIDRATGAERQQLD
jgi:hypothetical protein